MEHHQFNTKAFSLQPGYDEPATRAEFAKLMSLRTLVVYCFDPRAAGIPDAVAKEFGDIFPGDIVTDANGNGIGTTTTLLPVVVAGGRAMDALRSVTVAQHLVGVQNVVVVHHTHCGATSYTEDGIVAAYKREHGTDITDLYPRESVCITDYDTSLAYDTKLIRESAGTPRHVNIYGYVYDIDDGSLTRLVEDLGATQALGVTQTKAKAS